MLLKNNVDAGASVGFQRKDYVFSTTLEVWWILTDEFSSFVRIFEIIISAKK